MGPLRREVTVSLLGRWSLGLVVLILGACSSDDTSASDGVDSPCKAFAIAPDPRYELEAAFGSPAPNITRFAASSAHTYGLAKGGKVFVLDGASVAVDLSALAPVTDIGVSKDGAYLFVLRGAREVVRLASTNGGLTFDAAAAAPVVSIAPASTSDAGGAIFVDPVNDVLWAATADDTPSAAQDDAKRTGKVLRVTGALAPGATTSTTTVDVFARGFHQPSGITVDHAAALNPDGDVWVSDVGLAASEIDRVSKGKSYGWPEMDGNRCASQENTCARDPHVLPVVAWSSAAGARGVVVHRGGVAPLASLVLTTSEDGNDVVAIAPYGPSGPPLVTKLGAGPATHVGAAANGSLLVATDANVSRVKDIAPSAPSSLRATGCEGDPAGAIHYDVASPLWSDGADKERFVVIPKGESARTTADGDIKFPVGTVAVKTFKVDGKKVETRLFIQHSLDTWVGYTYAWSDDGSDASLVIGNRAKALANDKRWYFPSSNDCAACHTPAAGYTLGLESRQIAPSSDAATALDARLLAPIDHTRFPPLANAKTDGTPAEARARSYLHSNCSMCHREGSATGLAELDLRFDTPLDRTGLCAPPKAGSLGIADARVVAPKDEARSVLLRRIQLLDESRMPKLASHVIDDAAVATIKEWIGGMTSCP